MFSCVVNPSKKDQSKAQVPWHPIKEDRLFFPPCTHACLKHGHRWHHKTVSVCAFGGGVYGSKAVEKQGELGGNAEGGDKKCPRGMQMGVHVNIFFFCPVLQVN